MLRILHIFRAPLGGLFRHVCDLAAEQKRAGHHVGIVCDAGSSGAAVEQQLNSLSSLCSLGVARIPMARTLSRRDITAAREIRRIAERLRPDIVHGHGAKGGAFARLLPRNGARLHLYTPHGGTLHYDWHSPSGALFLMLERMLRRHTDGIIFESAFGAAAYRAKIGMPACPMRVIPNGLAAGEFAPLRKQSCDYDIVFVGELRRLKGLATLIEAVALLSLEKPLRIGIAGTGPDEGDFRKLTAARGLSATIDFLGYRASRDVFASGRVIAIPSLAESFPYTVLEALASGRPVVATSVGGVPEIYGPYAGNLVPPGDVPALADALRDGLDGSGAVLARAQRLKERVFSHFSATKMGEEITTFYVELQRMRRGSAAELSKFLNPQETTAI